VSLLKTVVGIDPSGKRLALIARGAGLARSVPPAVAPLRAEREQARFEEAEGLLREYVARHGLSGCAARLCVPASRVYTARVAFPPLRNRDLRAALEVELERLFPVPSSRLLFGWRRLGKGTRGKANPLVVAAVPSEYVERWRESAARAGLSLTSAIPSAWALASVLSEVGSAETDGIAVVLRDAGGDVECALLSGGEPFFSAVRAASEETGPAAGIQAAAAGLLDPPGDPDVAPPTLFAPDRWDSKARAAAEELGIAVHPAAGFETLAARAISVPEGAEAPTVCDLIGAHGAAGSGSALNLLDGGDQDSGSRSTRWIAAGLGALAVFFAAAWPGIVAWKTRAEAARLEGELAAMRPKAAQVEKALADLDGVGRRIAFLAEMADGREEPLILLRDLTDRLPQGTWLTGLRVENRNLEIDGLSPAANEIFPLLSRDGRFRKVEFASPITRQADNIERFQIRAEYSPSAEKKGGAR